MRVVLSNLGSLGDVYPLLALAFELRKRGHCPTLLVASQFREDIERRGFEFRPLGLDLDYRALQQQDTLSELNGDDPLMMHRRSLQIMEGMLPLMFEQTLSACGRSDLLIAGHLQPAARMVHETALIPLVSIHINHFGGLQARAFREEACAIINPFRRGHGLPPLTDPFHSDAHSPQLALHAISRYLRPMSVRLPHHHVTGFFFLDDPSWRPDRSLVEFIQAGEPPIVISFSSMVHGDPIAVTNLLSEVISRVGRRAVIQSGWSGLARGSNLQQGIHVSGFVPHTWLFMQACCVVHQGGAGTTASVLRSGVPSVFVPHQVDQPIFAELVRGLGCTGRAIPYRDLNADSLTQAIVDTLNDCQISHNASLLANKIRNEHGVENACILIDKLLHNIGVCL